MDAEARRADVRREFYKKLFDYVTVVQEMLNEVSDSCVERLNGELARLARNAQERAGGEDEFGRSLQGRSVVFKGSGCDSPDESSGGELGEEERVGSGEFGHGNSEENFLGDGPLANVADEFKSIRVLTSRFL